MDLGWELFHKFYCAKLSPAASSKEIRRRGADRKATGRRAPLCSICMRQRVFMVVKYLGAHKFCKISGIQTVTTCQYLQLLRECSQDAGHVPEKRIRPVPLTAGRGHLRPQKTCKLEACLRSWRRFRDLPYQQAGICYSTDIAQIRPDAHAHPASVAIAGPRYRNNCMSRSCHHVKDMSSRFRVSAMVVSTTTPGPSILRIVADSGKNLLKSQPCLQQVTTCNKGSVCCRGWNLHLRHVVRQDEVACRIQQLVHPNAHADSRECVIALPEHHRLSGQLHMAKLLHTCTGIKLQAHRSFFTVPQTNISNESSGRYCARWLWPILHPSSGMSAPEPSKP